MGSAISGLCALTRRPIGGSAGRSRRNFAWLFDWMPTPFFLRHHNRRSAHLVTHAGDDHRPHYGVAASHVILDPVTEVAVAYPRPQRPVQRTTLFSMKYARSLVPDLRHPLDI